MGTQTNRLPSGGRIDRGTEITFTVDGVEHTGHPGDTIASALIANGRVRVGDSIYRGRPRGILAAGGEEPNALVQILGEHSEPSVTATVRSLTDGLTARTLSGLGVLDPEPDTAAYDKLFVHTDVLVIGAGPSGLAAALSAARSGARVILLDEQAELGGSLLASRTELVDGKPALEWVAAGGRDARRGRGGHGAHPHGRLRLVRRQLRARRRGPDRRPRPPRSPTASPASGSGTSARPR